MDPSRSYYSRVPPPPSAHPRLYHFFLVRVLPLIFTCCCCACPFFLPLSALRLSLSPPDGTLMRECLEDPMLNKYDVRGARGRGCGCSRTSKRGSTFCPESCMQQRLGGRGIVGRGVVEGVPRAVVSAPVPAPIPPTCSHGPSGHCLPKQPTYPPNTVLQPFPPLPYPFALRPASNPLLPHP